MHTSTIYASSTRSVYALSILHALLLIQLVLGVPRSCSIVKHSYHCLQVAVEYHKRFDPIYSDARNRIRHLGPFSYYYSYMAQPKQQLDTFKSWAGKSSDINYYLNSHHIDVHNWCVGHMAYPTKVSLMVMSVNVCPVPLAMCPL